MNKAIVLIALFLVLNTYVVSAIVCPPSQPYYCVTSGYCKSASECASGARDVAETEREVAQTESLTGRKYYDSQFIK